MNSLAVDAAGAARACIPSSDSGMDGVLVLTEPNPLRSPLLVPCFPRILFGPHTMHKDRKTARDRWQLELFCLRAGLVIRRLRPALVLCAWTEPVVAPLLRLRAIGAIPGTRIALMTRRTILERGPMFSRSLRMRDARRLDGIISFSTRMPATFGGCATPEVRFLPFEPGIPSRPVVPTQCADARPVVFAGGGLGRDYATLVAAAAAGLPAEVHIHTWLAPPFGHQDDWPANCRIRAIDASRCTLADPEQQVSLENWLREIAEAAVVAVPLQPTWEVRGLTVVLQAIRMGKAIVASRHPGLDDYLVDGVNAILVSPGSREELHQALRQVILDGGLRARLEAGARQLAAAMTPERLQSRLVEICREWITPGNARQAETVAPGAQRDESGEKR